MFLNLELPNNSELNATNIKTIYKQRTKQSAKLKYKINTTAQPCLEIQTIWKDTTG